MQFYWILALVFALIVAIFAIQNASLVDIRFLNWEFADISLVLVILGSAVIGAVIIFYFGLFQTDRVNLEIERGGRENQEAGK